MILVQDVERPALVDVLLTCHRSGVDHAIVTVIYTAKFIVILGDPKNATQWTEVSVPVAAIKETMIVGTPVLAPFDEIVQVKASLLKEKVALNARPGSALTQVIHSSA